MKQVLSLVFTLCFAVFINGQSLGQIAYICTDGNVDIYEFFTYEDEENVAMFANYASNAVWYLDTKAGIIYRFYAERLDTEDNSSPAYFYIGEELVSVVDIHIETECLSDDTLPIPHNECLGVNPIDYGLPESGVFMVDNQAYRYNGNLSFLVPLDTVWQWDLYVDEQYILSFEQTESEACHIVNEVNNG